MTQPALEQFSKRALLLKLETTPGVDASPTAGADAFQVMDGTSQLQSDTVDRNVDRPYFTNTPFGVTNIRGTLQGNFEIVPSATPGTTEAAVSSLLQIAGLAATLDAVNKTTTYNPISESIKTASAYWYHSGTLRKVLGSRADVSGLAIAIGDYLKGQMSLQGSCDDVSEAALPTGLDYSAFTEPLISTHDNTTLKYGAAGSAPSTVLWGKSLSIDFGNEIGTKEYTSHEETGITDRKATFTTTIAQPDLANDFDPWADWKAGKLIALAYNLKDPATNLYSELGIRGQIESVNPTDIDGDYGLEIQGRCIASSAGGDEFYLEQGDSTP